MTPREVENSIATDCITFTEEMMGKSLTERQRDAIKVAVEFVLSLNLRRLKCMPQPSEMDTDMKCVLQHAVIRMNRTYARYTLKQHICINVIFYWHEPAALEYIKTVAMVKA
jgi:hypothetical protein